MIKGPTIMYTTSQHPGQPSINTLGGDLDGSGTINPAALNNAGSVLPTPTSLNNASMQSPRGLKRSRSPEQYAGDAGAVVYNDNDDRPKQKRGRPSKERGPEDLILPGTGQAIQGQLPTPQTATHNQQSLGQHPQSASVQAPPPAAQQPQSIPAAAPKQASPAKPAGKTVVKALPTVRDHTTDQLNPENDEYIPRETDPEGEKKVMPNGRLTGNREYKCRTFLVPNRGDKLFMLATECARVLGYRDSYLLFNKNRSLYKIIATQAEKDDLIHQDILPYSYRSRQIAIVTARSMFRQFGSRVINNGRRVRDDYWEAKARKQGFTEEDLAGEKRPGAAKREAAAQEAAANAAAAHHTHHNDVIYSTPVDPHGQPMPMTYGGMMHANYHLPMINPHPGPNDDIRSRFDYTNIQRPKQEIAGPAYQDKTQLSSMSEIMNQAGHTSDYNHALDQQRRLRGGMLKEQWKREQPVTSPGSQETAAAPALSQAMQSPHLALGAQQPMLQPQPGQAGYQQAAAAQGSPTSMRNQPPQRHASIPYASNQVPQSPGYAYQSHMWQQQAQQPPQAQQQHSNQAAAAAAAAQAQQSPVTAQHNASQYSPQTPGHNQQHNQSPHPTQSPHNMPGQAGQHHQNPASMQPPPQMSGYQMPAMGMQQAYGNMPGRGMYQQPQQPHHSYMQQSGPGAAAGMAGWAAPPGGQQAWQGPSY